MRKQAEPGAPNLKPGTAPGPSVVKRSAGGQPAHTREQDKFPSSWSVGELHRFQRQHPWGLQSDAFGFYWPGRGKNPAAFPCPQQGAWVNESHQAPMVWTPCVTLQKQMSGLAGSVTSRAGFWDAWGRLMLTRFLQGTSWEKTAFSDLLIFGISPTLGPPF